MALRMIAQLGPPTWFLTLTAYELQPQLLLACAFAHLRTMPALERESVDQITKMAAEGVDVLMHQRDLWHGLTALELCKLYPATTSREFMCMLREFLRWLAPMADEEGEGRWG